MKARPPCARAYKPRLPASARKMSFFRHTAANGDSRELNAARALRTVGTLGMFTRTTNLREQNF